MEAATKAVFGAKRPAARTFSCWTRPSRCKAFCQPWLPAPACRSPSAGLDWRRPSRKSASLRRRSQTDCLQCAAQRDLIKTAIDNCPLCSILSTGKRLWGRTACYSLCAGCPAKFSYFVPYARKTATPAFWGTRSPSLAAQLVPILPLACLFLHLRLPCFPAFLLRFRRPPASLPSPNLILR